MASTSSTASTGRTRTLIQGPILTSNARLPNGMSRRLRMVDIQLGGEVGKGAEGWVQKGRLEGRNIAIKFSDKTGSFDLVREAEFTSGLDDSPHIVKTLGWGIDGDRTFMAMEFLKESLHDRIQKRGVFSPSTAVNFTLQICKGLQVVGLHRDLKPRNIMIEDGCAKLIDMSLAAREVKAGHIVGTMEYMSPEQLKGELIDQRSEIYALGCIMYEMLMGTRLFTSAEEQTRSGVFKKRDDLLYQKENIEEVDVDESLNAVINKAVRPRKEARYSTLDDFIGELEEIKQRLNKEADELDDMARDFLEN